MKRRNYDGTRLKYRWRGKLVKQAVLSTQVIDGFLQKADLEHYTSIKGNCWA